MSKLSQIFTSGLFPMKDRSLTDADLLKIAQEEGEHLYQYLRKRVKYPEVALSAVVGVLAELLLLQEDDFKRIRLLHYIHEAIREVMEKHQEGSSMPDVKSSGVPDEEPDFDTVDDGGFSDEDNLDDEGIINPEEEVGLTRSSGYQIRDDMDDDEGEDINEEGEEE